MKLTHVGLAAALLAVPVLRAQMPAAAPPRPFDFPKHAKKVLANGLTVYVVEDHRLPVVSCSLQIIAGNAQVPPPKSGLASLTASLLRDGTATRTSQQISRLVDSVGGSLGASANDDTTAISATFMKSYADLGFELLADITLNPKFDQEEIDRTMRQLQSNLAVAYNDAEYLAPLLSARGILGTHPYAYPGSGTPETLRGIKREDIVGFHKTWFSPTRAYFAVAGDLTPDEAFAKAEKYLGTWKTPAPQDAKLPAPPAPAAKVLVLDKPDSNQTQIIIGHVGVPRNHPDYVALHIANQIFGDGANFNSRLNTKLRANEGLTYGASSSVSPQRQAGLFTLSTSTRTEKTATAIQFMMDLIKEWKQDPGSEAEFAEAKEFLIGVFGLSLETPGAVAQRVVNTAIFGLPEDYWSNYRKELQSLTREQMVAAVQRFLQPDRMVITTVGNSKEYAKELAKYGPVTQLEIADLDLVADNLLRKKEAVVATAESTAAAKKMVETAAVAMGGREKLLAVKDMTAKGSMKLTTPQGQMDASTEESLVYPDKYRLTLTLGSMGQIVQAVDGSTAYMMQGPMSRDVPANLAAEMRKNIPTAGGVGLIAAALSGQAEVLPVDGDTVQWKMDGFEVKIDFDQTTRLISKVTYRAQGMGGAAEVENSLSDYRDVDGLKLPFSEVILQNGQKFGERTILERKVNTGIDAAAFKKPTPPAAKPQ